MSDSEDVNRGHLHATTTENDTGSISGASKSKVNRSGTAGKNKSGATTFRRSEIGIEELRGNIFTYGTQGQQSNYIRTKKAIADYVGTTFKFAKELYKAINGGEEVELQEPEKPASTKPSQIEMKRYEVLCNRFFAKVEEYERERTKLFRLIMGQCSPTLRDKLESMKGFPGLEEKDNFIGLLELIHKLVYGTDNGQYEYWKMQASMIKLAGMKQEPREPTISFAERFLTQVQATESLWGPLVPTTGRMNHTPFETLEGEDEAGKMQRMEQWIKDMENKLSTQALNDEKSREKFLACLFLASTDRDRYKCWRMLSWGLVCY
jgi:hypothetical protein